ncbi:nuclear transport factor 2 family protein [Sphingomonas asaccharolytica]|uniref:nuclear transport factor 2 family protein n=1 Tax=Sphingomonas asaccharolytica TaxID=40681 RepID=UPI00082B2EC5|nr:nuclear transport factor 2 family protein [Sphingomonas asaccharolytica]
MSEADRIAKLESTVEQLSRRLLQREDELDIRKLQYLYGYLIDKCLYNETVDLFADDGEVRFFGGVWRGKEGARRLYVERFQKRFTHGTNGPIDGFLLDHPQIQDIIDVEPGGEIAYGRARSMMQAGRHKDYTDPSNPMMGARQWWEGGIYENTYQKVDGVWRIKVLNYLPQWHADFETGWANTRPEYVPFPTQTFPQDPTGPDELIADSWLWPTHKVVPFHMKHPVTGKEIVAERWQGDIDRAQARTAEPAV